jgi:hypothetical protein
MHKLPAGGESEMIQADLQEEVSVLMILSGPAWEADRSGFSGVRDSKQ